VLSLESSLTGNTTND